MQNNRHTELVRQALLILSTSKLCRAWANNTGSAFRNGRMIQFGLKGSADITGILIDGRRLEVEIKTGSGRQNSDQKLYEGMIRKFGGVYWVIRSCEELQARLDELRKELEAQTKEVTMRS